MPEAAPISPQLSVSVVTRDSFSAIHRGVECLQAQTARDQLELVVVAPDADSIPELTAADWEQSAALIANGAHSSHD